MSPAPHADRDHSEAPETDQWRSNYATLCRALVLAKRDSEAAEAERDRARSLAATLEARLAQVEALDGEWQRLNGWPSNVAAPTLRAILNPQGDA